MTEKFGPKNIFWQKN